MAPTLPRHELSNPHKTVAWIGARLHQTPSLSRYKLAKDVCTHLNWYLIVSAAAWLPRAQAIQLLPIPAGPLTKTVRCWRPHGRPVQPARGANANGTKACARDGPDPDSPA